MGGSSVIYIIIAVVIAGGLLGASIAFKSPPKPGGNPIPTQTSPGQNQSEKGKLQIGEHVFPTITPTPTTVPYAESSYYFESSYVPYAQSAYPYAQSSYYSQSSYGYSQSAYYSQGSYYAESAYQSAYMR